MKLYKNTVDFYDKIFPLNRDKIEFVKKSVPDIKDNILDIGCATAALDIELAKSGFSIYALDIDEDMISRAKEKAMKEETEIDFRLGSMLELEKIYADTKFNLILCFGNTIAHLEDTGQVETFLKECYAVLNNNGKIIVQMINYDRILKENIEKLPLIDNEIVKFERYYERTCKKINFRTLLTVKSTNEIYENNTVQNPLLQFELLNSFLECGFPKIEMYSDFKFSTADDNSMSINYIANKS
jgi:glycine/sarcosine N-methyltransferase